MCRNEVQRIRRTSDSIVSQRFKDFEWIVIDGGSTDGTVDILKEYRSRIKYFISEADEGIYHAMNKGLNKASGEYIYFLNGGDYIASRNAIKDLFEYLQNEIAVANILFIFPNGKKIIRNFSQNTLDKDYLYWRGFPHQATIIHSELFKRSGLYDTNYKICADRDFFCRAVIIHKAKVQYIPVHLAVFYQDGISFNKKDLVKIERKKIRKKYFSISYRFRREFNDWYGRMQQNLRERLS